MEKIKKVTIEMALRREYKRMQRLRKQEKAARKEAKEHDHSGHYHPPPKKSR